jgi:hypothetical protein
MGGRQDPGKGNDANKNQNTSNQNSPAQGPQSKPKRGSSEQKNR